MLLQMLSRHTLRLSSSRMIISRLKADFELNVGWMEETLFSSILSLLNIKLCLSSRKNSPTRWQQMILLTSSRSVIQQTSPYTNRKMKLLNWEYKKANHENDAINKKCVTNHCNNSLSNDTDSQLKAAKMLAVNCSKREYNKANRENDAINKKCATNHCNNSLSNGNDSQLKTAKMLAVKTQPQKGGVWFLHLDSQWIKVEGGLENNVTCVHRTYGTTILCCNR